MTFRRKTCPHCRSKLEAGQRIHPQCIDGYAEAEAAKAKRKAEKQARMAAKVERATTRARKQALKRIPDLIKEAQHAFNAFIRERDKYRPCICCEAPLSRGGGSTGGDFDCGHYRSTGTASHLRFDERNAHGQRKVCNRYGAGRAVDYRVGLIRRIGVDAVEALEADNNPHKWTREELIAIKAKYVQKLKNLKREAA